MAHLSAMQYRNTTIRQHNNVPVPPAVYLMVSVAVSHYPADLKPHHFLFFNQHIFISSLLVGGSTLGDFLDKPWSQVGVFPFPPRYEP